MYFNHPRALIMLTTLSLAVAGSGMTRAETTDGPLELVFNVPDVSSRLGQTGQYIDIHITNYFDTIAGFQFVLVSERPDLVTFDFDHFGFDTAGTLVSGFEYVQAIDKEHDQSQLWFRCIANLPPGAYTHGFPPQQGGVAVRIPYRTTSTPDTALPFECQLTVGTPFDFSNPWGYSIGTAIDTSYDSTWYKCNSWQGDSCLDWTMASFPIPGFDSMSVDTISYGYLDTTRVVTIEGSVSIDLVMCDNNASGTVNVVDLTCLVHYLFGGPGSGCPFIYCDWDGSGSTNIVDLLQLVEYLFGG